MNKWTVKSHKIATEMHTLQAQVQAAVDSKFPSEELKISTLEVCALSDIILQSVCISQ